VGTYAILQGSLALSSNYSLTYVGANLTINTRPVTVTADPQSKTYGDADPALTYQITSGSLAFSDSFSGALTRVAGENVGTYAILQGTLALNSNYSLTYVGANLTITPRNLSVTADAKSKVYGDSDPALTYTHGALYNGDTDSVFTGGLQRAAGENVGSYAITQGTLSAGSNYNILFTGANFSITPRNLTVAADAKTKVYGDSDPALTYTHGALYNGDTDSVFTGGLQRAPGENVGTYAITQGTLSAGSNYNILFTGANFSITPRPATVTADNKSKTYGDANPALTATVTGTVNGDTLNYTLATTALQFSNVGTYPITVTLGSNPNYNVTANNGALTITQRPATVTADNKSKTYGDANPTLTATVTGTVNGDTLNYNLATTALQFSNVGTYAITVTLGTNPNYNVTANNGTLTITQRSATVMADNKTKAYLAPNPTLTATVTGTVNGDMLNYTLATTATQTSLPGTYPITVTLGSNPNYSVTKTDGTLTIGYGTCTGPNGPGMAILQPINPDGSSVFKVGSTVPVKFTICDANGNPISDPMAVFGNSTGSITLLSAVRGTVNNVNEAIDNDIPDVAFRYSSGIWIFNMATSNLTKNTTYYYQINLKVGGPILFHFATK
jgi:trimeric autotransporter adhesin